MSISKKAALSNIYFREDDFSDIYFYSMKLQVRIKFRSMRRLLYVSDFSHTFRRYTSLFHGHGFCEVSWLIDIESLGYAYIVGEKL